MHIQKVYVSRGMLNREMMIIERKDRKFYFLNLEIENKTNSSTCSENYILITNTRIKTKYPSFPGNLNKYFPFPAPFLCHLKMSSDFHQIEFILRNSQPLSTGLNRQGISWKDHLSRL